MADSGVVSGLVGSGDGVLAEAGLVPCGAGGVSLGGVWLSRHTEQGILDRGLTVWCSSRRNRAPHRALRAPVPAWGQGCQVHDPGSFHCGAAPGSEQDQGLGAGRRRRVPGHGVVAVGGAHRFLREWMGHGGTSASGVALLASP